SPRWGRCGQSRRWSTPCGTATRGLSSRAPPARSGAGRPGLPRRHTSTSRRTTMTAQFEDPGGGRQAVEGDYVERMKAREEAERARPGERRVKHFTEVLASGLGPRLKAAMLDNFQVYHPSQGRVLEHLRGVARKLREISATGGGLVFYGPCGTGKDHLAVALMRLAICQFGWHCGWVSAEAV